MKVDEIKWLFPTPILEFNLQEYLTPEISKSLISMKRKDNSLVDGIRGDINPKKLPECKKLYEVFQECVNDYSQRIGIRNSLIFDSWMNILTKGGSVDVHRHYDSIISAAFYPYVEPDSADLIFINPLEGFRMMDANASNSKDNGVYSSNIRPIQPTTGKLVLFPSWIQHYVPTNKSNLRVTLSFNTRFDR
jgi:uncharacterized protein (TIGR02466 family)